jgi:hypothetical protein
MTRTTIAVATGLAFAATLPAISAYAAARDRVFVASYGSDSNPCTFGSPCKTFQQAINTVAPGGEVTAIDSAGFGPVTIAQSVTITSPNGVEAGIAAPAPGTAAIAINTTSGDEIITLSGLTLDGANVSNSTGISFSGFPGRLTIRDSVIRNFTKDGIDFSPGGQGHLTISNTVVSDNGSAGIAFYPTGDIGKSSVIPNRVEMINNTTYGLFLWGTPSNAGEKSLLPFPSAQLRETHLDMAFTPLRTRVTRRSCYCSIPLQLRIALVFRRKA